MIRFARWLRGALAVGLTWAVLWIVFGIVLGSVIWIFQPEDIGPGEGLSKALPILGLVGLLSGLGFAALLSLAERRRKLRELSLARVALWGLLGSAAVPWLMGADGSEGWLTGFLGATFAAGSVAIARRGADRLEAPSDAVCPTITAPQL
jgi:hypothetical protein